jgi:hypothetical protein
MTSIPIYFYILNACSLKFVNFLISESIPKESKEKRIIELPKSKASLILTLGKDFTLSYY